MSGAETPGTPEIDDGDPRDLRAAEYVLGTLDAAERLGVESDCRTDAALRAAILEWERFLTPMAALVSPVEPSGAVWARLAAATGAASPAGAANDDSVVIGRRLRLWRLTAASSSAAALGFAAAFLGIVFLSRAPAPAPVPVVPSVASVAALNPMGAPGPVFIASIDEDGSIRLRPVKVGQVPSNRSLELWALAAGSKTPVPLGVIASDGLTARSKDMVAAGGQLLVSLEPAGGSPTGLPTGPVLYGGTVLSR